MYIFRKPFAPRFKKYDNTSGYTAFYVLSHYFVMCQCRSYIFQP